MSLFPRFPGRFLKGGNMKLKVGDKVKVILQDDEHLGRVGTIEEVLVLGVVVTFKDGIKRIYHKRGEVVPSK